MVSSYKWCIKSAMPIGVLATNCLGRSKNKPIERKKEEWSRPVEGITKINVDATYDIGQCNRGMGAIARDNNGKLLVASCK
jgi:hypothetical protein